MPAPKYRRFPLHVHISVLFTCLLLFSGTLLGLFNYHQTTTIIFDSSQKLFAGIEQDVRQDLEHTYKPIRSLLNLLANENSYRGHSLLEHLFLLKPFAQALRDNSDLNSLYLADSSGGFFMVRPLRGAALRSMFQAPDNARFMVWSIERNPGEPPRSQYLFFDNQLTLLDTRPDPDDLYDPRTRDWYRQAASGQPITSRPYLFFSTREVGTTLAQKVDDQVVLGADLRLAELSQTLQRHKVTPDTQVVLFDDTQHAVAYFDPSRLVSAAGDAQLRPVSEIDPLLGRWLADHGTSGTFFSGARRWIVSRSHIEEGGPKGLDLALLVPEDELLEDAYRVRWQSALVTLTVLLFCLPLGWLLSRMLVRPLNSLVNEADSVRSFDFSRPFTKRSPVLEVDQLSLSMQQMKQTLASFFEITASLGAETRFNPLLQRVLQETISLSGARGGLIYLYDAETAKLEPNDAIVDDQRQGIEALGLITRDLNDPALPDWLRALGQDRDHMVLDLGFESAADLQGTLRALDSPRVHLVGIRLHNRHRETVGVLILLHPDTGSESDLENLQPDRVAFIQAVSGVAAACIESQFLQVRQQRLLESFIQLIAGAIDAKSPYTGGHCQRVPLLTMMLAKAAAHSHEAPFTNYQPTDDEWEALRIAAWLHDCGKVTTPEYVVDKATKLETLYDRIHEVRMRFELLKCQAWADYWQDRSKGGDETDLAARRDARLTELDEDFAFVARCNLGSEGLDDNSRARLTHIAEQTWVRTLDDRLGVSWEENLRQQRSPAKDLPATEPLLADRPEHLFERPDSERIAPDNPWGFKMDVPHYKYNRGELYNLGIGRGTLTAEERYIINHHMVQTIMMLSRLPFPPHLAGITEIAGGHHEKMDGTGYPRRLTREQMSLPARMMAIADIFEALTAADRPYKKGKSLSQALEIMAGMCRDSHIDPQLFELFVKSGIHRQYAMEHMASEQIDEVDERKVLEKAGLREAQEATSRP